MFHMFGPLRGVLHSSSITIDNQIFRLHYQVTVTLLMAFGLLITARQYFGDPISCLQKEGIPSNVLDTYCWIHSTFSLESAWYKRVGNEVPYPGIDRSHHNDRLTAPESRIYHGYYQWVWVVLFVQAIFFYLPHYAWKRMENGLTKSLSTGLAKPLVNELEKYENLQLLVDFIKRSREMNVHQKLFYSYLLCELLNLLNVIFQMLLMNRLLNGQFFNYGLNVLNFYGWTWPLQYDPMLKVFPRVTKCEYFKFGQSGEVETLDTLCLLPVNILNEKIYIFLWFWFWFLAITSFLTLQWRVCTAIFPCFRVSSIYQHCKSLSKKCIDNVNRHGKLGDWFVLHLLAKNLNEVHFYDLVVQLEKELNKEKMV